MQNTPTRDTSATRPKIVQNSKSFSRLESPPRTPPRTRASTVSSTSPNIVQNELLSAVETDHGQKSHLYNNADDRGVPITPSKVTSPTLKSPESFDELPIEIRSLTERFLESLSAKVHPTPLSVDALADLFQEFYTKAESHIAAHIATLSLKIGRERSPTPSVASRTSSNSRNGPRKDSPARKVSGDQQMLTASEITDRKKARRLLELKKAAWEETVERTVVGRVYGRIYRHRSADDEERDQKLRSRIAALSLVGIGLKELLAGADGIPDEMREKTVREQDHIRELLSGARSNLHDMDAETYPLGKLQHLTAAHKSIVETLSELFPASSSADEILPTLIYALITSPPENVNVISNLKFIQRFRANSKVDGEAAYCLVNLEAAASFLETVDLPSLRADEAPEGPEKTDRPSTPRTLPTPMSLGIAPAADPAVSTSGNSSPGSTKPLPSPVKQQRRLSNLLSMQTTRINEASDSFRGAILDSADSAFDTINSTLESSFKFVFGRMREHQAQSNNESKQEVVLPKTLEDARKLVSAPSAALDEGDDVSINTGSSVPEGDDPLPKPANERVTEIFAGRRPIRDSSVDSIKSGGSGKRVAFDTTGTSPPSTGFQTSIPSSAVPAPNAAVESMRNFGNTINPLNQLSRMGGLFARAGSGTSTPTPAAVPSGPVSEKALPSSGVTTPLQTVVDAKAIAALEDLKRMAPPNKRFVDCQEARELKLGEVEELLKDYQRLANALGKATSAE